MPIAYTPPGTSVTEVTSNSLSPLLAVPGSIYLVGLAAGGITQTDPAITLTGTTAMPLVGVPRGATMMANVSTTVSGAGQTISTTPSTLTVAATAGMASAGTVWVAGVAAPVTYTGITGTTFTGCTVPAGSFTATNTGSVVYAPALISVMDATAPQTAPYGYSPATDFTFTPPSGTGSSWVAPTIVRTGGSTIPSGNSVYVTYTYTPSDYFQPIRLGSMTDIEARFGTAWDVTGTFINSRLSHGAQLAFANGASSIVLQPLYVISGGNRVQASSTQAATASTWSTVFNGLLSQEDLNLLVPVVGQSDPGMSDATQLQIIEAVQDYVYTMATTENQYVIGVVGEDASASSTNAQESTLITHAQTLIPRYAGAVTEQMVFVNTAQFSRANNSGSILVGGQYMATAIAGMLASRDPAATLTRQAVSGFLAVTDLRSTAAKNNDAQNGMLVVESKGNVVQVRHGITMDATSVATRELNVIRAKHFIIESVLNTLNTQVIGRVPADGNATTIVNNVVIGALEELRGLGTLVDYSGVQSAITSIDPTTLLVAFTYLPEFIINYVNLQFSLDLSAQSVTVTTNGTTQ